MELLQHFGSGWPTLLVTTNLMLAWTVLILVCIVMQFVFGASMLPYLGYPPATGPAPVP